MPSQSDPSPEVLSARQSATSILHNPSLATMAPSSDALSDLKDAFDPKAIATGLYRESHFITPCIREMEIISAARPSSTSASIVYRLPVTQDILNPTGSMHGGAIATLYDVCTTWLLFLVEGWKPVLGTTRSLNCVYLRPAREGDFVRVECEVCFPFLLGE